MHAQVHTYVYVPICLNTDALKSLTVLLEYCFIASGNNIRTTCTLFSMTVT